MPDLHDHLDHEARRVHSEPGSLGAMLDRASRRRRARRITSAVLALAVAGGGIGLAVTAFRPAREIQPGGQPVPGPSVSASPAEIRAISVLNASGTEGAAEFAAAVMTAQGVEIDVVDVAPLDDWAETTTIHCHPLREEEALQLRDRFFPGAELRPRIQPEVLEIRIGQDFLDAQRPLFEMFMTVRSFLTRRLEGDGAETFLSGEAAQQYGSGDGGLSLYEEVSDAPFFSIRELASGENDTAVAIALMGERSERLTVGTRDGRLQIVNAELLAPGPVEQVLMYVRGFLRARRQASGAGTYLGERAREAYATHENGLDLLGYVASDELRFARIGRYDKLSADMHRVEVHFVLQGSERIIEALTIEPLEGGFVIADAERIAPA